MKKMMLLIDGHGLAFRGFYALPDTLFAPDGTPTNAILGFTGMLVKCLDEWQPDGVGLFFDPKGPTRRNQMYEEYKEQRKPTPEGFKAQLPLIVEISRAMGIPVFIRDGVEADDYICSTAQKSAAEGWRVHILSADKDLFQIIGEYVQVIRPTKGISEFTIYDVELFRRTYGFEPPLMADYLALVGDSVDNIPGVSGIGEKGAKELVADFGKLEAIYENLDALPPGKRAKLEAGRERAFMSRDLIIPQITEYEPVEHLQIGEPDHKVLRQLLQRLALKKLSDRFGYAYKAQARASAARLEDEIQQDYVYETQLTMPQERPLEEVLKHHGLALVRAVDGLLLVSEGGVSCGLDARDADTMEKWKKWCGGGTLTLYGLRRLLSEFHELPLPELERIRDVEIAHYLLHPDRGGEAIEKTIGHELPQDARQGCELFALWEKFAPLLREMGLEKLMREIDLPLSRTLAQLQLNGISVSHERLQKLESELQSEIAKTEESISQMAGESINLNSSKQVGYLLFEKLSLPPIKKTKTGYSTDVSVLEKLARLPEPLCNIPARILEYREQAKILSGFVQPFLKLAGAEDGKIHSTFDHLSTGTGRLSSYDPNVQNMPAFGRYASAFRDCFVPASDDRMFISADYSQIELRVLAHLSGEEKLIEAFERQRDIHTDTASWVFGLPADKVTHEQRRFAKVVNFGLLYGMGAFGLAQRLGISRMQSQTMVERYFSVFPGIRSFLDRSVAEAKEAGFTRSIFGRVRPLQEVATVEGRGNSPLDRVALNTPIQSAASDIAKIALIRFSDAAAKEFKDVSVVLQIHDSIVCECGRGEADLVERRLAKVMESVDVLRVPVKVETSRGFSLSAV